MLTLLHLCDSRVLTKPVGTWRVSLTPPSVMQTINISMLIFWPDQCTYDISIYSRRSPALMSVHVVNLYSCCTTCTSALLYSDGINKSCRFPDTSIIPHQLYEPSMHQNHSKQYTQRCVQWFPCREHNRKNILHLLLCFSTSFIRLQDILSEDLEICFWNNGFSTAFPLLIIMCFPVVILA